jgi:hypothetical protein
MSRGRVGSCPHVKAAGLARLSLRSESTTAIRARLHRRGRRGMARLAAAWMAR